MFKPARWWSEKNRIKVVFKLHFHASQVTEVGGDELMISVVPGDTSKPSVKLDKAAVRDGSCLWENPVHETVKFNRDPKSGKIHQRMYYFVVGTGSSKSGVVGEASIDFSSYAESNKVSLVSLPLKNSKSEAILHVSIQGVHESMDQREMEENENSNLYSENLSLSSQLGDHDVDGSIRTTSAEDTPPSKTVTRAEFDTKLRVSSGSDITLSSSGSSSGLETHWETQMKNESLTTPGPKSDTLSPVHKEHLRSWEWLRDSALEEAPDIVIERLKADVAALSRQADVTELELQTLRKQVLKESKRGQDLWREVVCLKEERDALRGECQQLKASQRSNDAKTKTYLLFDGVDSQAIVEELRQELNHANELNTNLRIQLQKTQESNSELILAVRDLEEMLEQKNVEIPIPLSRSLEMGRDGESREGALACQPDNNDDDEQKALEEIVKEHSEVQESFPLEQEIADLRSEIEIYKREKDELEMQMEQLALDYEIMKQSNHSMACKLEQSEIQEQLKMQYECSSSDIAADELGTRIESLENELQGRTKEYEGSLVRINELQGHVTSLEKELEKQAQGFEADIGALTRSKVEQEQRAIRAEETLKKIRWKNSNAVERLQDDFRKLSVQMASTFEANEKLASKALAEANELRLQKSHLEEMLRKVSEEHQSVEVHYEAQLQELNSQVTMMTNNQIEQLQSNIEDRAVQLEHQKKHAEETQRLLSNEILMLKEELEVHVAKNKILLEEMESKEAMMHEVEKMKISIKEMELLVEQGNDEKIELESRVILMKTEAEELDKELNKMRSLVEEKELAAGNLQSELDSLQARCTELQHSLSADELEKEKLKKQVLQLSSDLKKEVGFKSMEKKTRDGSGRATSLEAVKSASKTIKPSPRGSKEVANLKERIKLLEGEIKVKETALEKSANTFLEKEEVLHKKIEDLEGRLDLKQSRAQFCDNKIAQPAAGLEDQASNGRLSDELSSAVSTTSSVNYGAFLSGKSEDLKDEMALLVMERNKSMERELKEMQERYSDMSLKFAEVEGERQQLIMKLRNLTNGKYSSHSTNLFAPVYW